MRSLPEQEHGLALPCLENGLSINIISHWFHILNVVILNHRVSPYKKEALADSGEYSEDVYIQRIQKSICKIKGSREMGKGI